MKKRKFILELSDEDVETLYKKAAKASLTVERLLESFVQDLTGSIRSNGSDERMYLDEWFDRCWFRDFSEMTFLRYAVEEEILDNVVQEMESMKDAVWKDFLEWTEMDPAKLDKTVEFEKVMEWKQSLDLQLEGYGESMEKEEKTVQDKNVFRRTAQRR